MSRPASPAELTADIAHMDAQQLREFTASLMQQLQQQAGDLCQKQQILEQQQRELARRDEKIRFTTVENEKLKYELAYLRRIRFGKKSEKLAGIQGLLFEEAIDEDLAAVETQLSRSAPREEKQSRRQPKRQPLPPGLPHTEIRHDPANRSCPCGCALKHVRDDESRKLGYVPGTFFVEHHKRGIWACPNCERIEQAPMPPCIIDKGIATPGLLAHVLVSKYGDHLPLYRQEAIYGRAGLTIARSTLGSWVGQCGVALQPLVDALRRELLEQGVLHADETPIRILTVPKEGRKAGKGWLWTFVPGEKEAIRAVVYHFSDNRAGENARGFLDDWKGALVCDDFGGYKKGFRQGITEVGCMAHARRRFHDHWVHSESPMAEEALGYIKSFYAFEARIRDLDIEQRTALRQRELKPQIDAFFTWLGLQRQKVANGTKLAKAIDYSLKRQAALMRFLDDGRLPMDNTHAERQLRPVAVGRHNWLFTGSLRAGQRAAAIMSLIQTAKLNGHDPLAYLTDVLTRLPTQPMSRIGELLPHRWEPAVKQDAPAAASPDDAT